MRQFKITSLQKLLVCFAAFSMLFFTSLHAQKTAARVIKGKITTAFSKVGLAGVNVTVKGTKNTIASEANGEFSILAQPGDVIVASIVGYLPKESKVTENTLSVSFELQQDISQLQDVVVIGYGKMKKTDLSSAVVTVSSAELQRTVNTTLDQALQGKASNVYVSQSSGAPGAGASVVIRGVSTLTGNYQPLYVIDGVQIRPSAPSGGAYNTVSGGNELAGINPEDIENISVLQGPAATSIYGAAGSNGVLMITTKRGKSGATKVSATSLYTLQQRPSQRPVMNLQQYAKYIEKLSALGLVGVQPPELGDPSILGPGTNWQNELFRPTNLQKHSLSLSGGAEKSTFYFSADYLSQNGVALGSGFQRGSARINLDNQATNWLKIGSSMSIFNTKEKINTTNGSLINLAITQNPTIPVKNPDGSFGGPAAAQAQYSQTNPVALALLNNNYNTSFGAVGGLTADVTPIKGLTWHSEINGNYSVNNGFTFNPSYTLGAYVNPNTQGSRSSGTNWWYSIQTRVQYELKLKKHYIAGMIGHENSYYEYKGLSGQGQNYSTNTIQELSVAAPLTQQTSSYRGNGASEAYFGRFNYIYNDKYIAQVVVRRDGSSNFGVANHWGNFPAVSLAWKISEEEFMKPLTFINDLKIRGEWGISGNSIGGADVIYSKLYAASTVWGTGFLPANYPNPDLKWEQDKSKNIGIDMHLFNNRVEVIADAYIKQVKNLILVVPGSGVLGGYLSGGYGGQVSWPTRNYGEMENKGYGVTVNTVNISKKDFQWKTGFNFSVDRNKVLKLNTPIITQYYSSTNSSQAQFLTQVGGPISQFTGYVAEGIFQDYNDIANHAIQTSNGVLTIDPVQGSWVGDVKFKDISGPKGIPDGIVDNFDRTIIGNPWPKFSYNFNSTFSYKGFDLNFFFIGVSGNDILNLTRYQNEMPLGTGPYSNHYQVAADFAVPSSLNAGDALTTVLTNPGTKIYRAAPNDANGNVRINQWSVEDGSYLKLKNARISYRVPTKILSRTHILKGLLATFQVQNVFTITKYKGFDPEVGMYNYGGTNLAGMDEGRYPSTRSYSFSLALDL